MTNLALIPTTIAPWLSVRDGARAVDFYKSAFAAIEVFRMDGGGSVVAWLSVEVRSFGWAMSLPSISTSALRPSEVVLSA